MSGKSGMYVGIAISVVIVVAIAVIGAGFYFKGSNLGEPVATAAPGMLDKIDMNLDLAKLINVPSGSGAEGPYREAVKLAVDYGDKFAEDADRAIHPEEDEKLKAILDKLEEGADKGIGETVIVFDSLPPVSAKTEWDIRGTLYGVAKVATHATMSLRKKEDKAGGDRAVRAGLLFGYRLFKNGENFVAYKSAGIASTSEALAEAGEQFKGDASKMAAQKEIYAAYRPIGEKWYEKQKIVLVPDLKINCADLWNMAEHDKDKAWRVEGIMWLGVAQWTSAKGGKERTSVQNYLESQTHSSDPLIAKYAKEALAMKREDVREVAFHLPR